MAEYTENMEAVVQNLVDAGCDKDTVVQFMELGKTGCNLSYRIQNRATTPP